MPSASKKLDLSLEDRAFLFYMIFCPLFSNKCACLGGSKER